VGGYCCLYVTFVSAQFNDENTVILGTVYALTCN
jgi:hypothetical protein